MPGYVQTNVVMFVPGVFFHLVPEQFQTNEFATGYELSLVVRVPEIGGGVDVGFQNEPFLRMHRAEFPAIIDHDRPVLQFLDIDCAARQQVVLVLGVQAEYPIKLLCLSQAAHEHVATLLKRFLIDAPRNVR
nr:hypothetical protein [uncultured Roseibium sp.]